MAKPQEAIPTMRQDPWLETARSAFESSSDWYDGNLRKQWERNLSMFQSKHPAGSKYFSGAYKHRAKVFRPKTRANVRANEAACASAFFSTNDVVSIKAQNDNDPAQQASSEIMQELLNYRLTKSIPWFSTVIGAYQDTQVMGIVCSKQHWDYEERRTTEKEQVVNMDGSPFIDPETGEPASQSVESVEVLIDEPKVELIPPENIRIDPASDWQDPVNSSPYLIRLVPMYLGEVIEKMSVEDTKTGEPKWKKLSEEQLLSTVASDAYDSTRSKRDRDRTDSRKKGQEINEFSTIWVHENIVRKDGKDFVYWTAGVEYMLTDPKPIEDVYLHGKRPYVIGCSTIETHKGFPAGIVELTQDLQTAANDIQNQRFDNVSLVLNKRYRVRRGSNVDLNALMRNTPGGAIMMNDPATDVLVDSTPDVTGSSYSEQDRINADFDELAGSFSGSSVGTNRRLNETVGGMSMMSSSASQITEYSLRVFAETWVEPVLRQLVHLEQAYETDETVLGIALEQAGAYQKYGVDQVTDDLLQRELTVSVNVGVGATNPQLQLEKFMYGLNTIAGIPEMMSRVKIEEITKEVFGKLGYKDGSRFFMSDEEIQKKMQEQGEAPPDPNMMKLEVDRQRLELDAQRMNLDAQKMQMDAESRQLEVSVNSELKSAELNMDREIAMAKLALEEDMTMAQLVAKLQLEREKQGLATLGNRLKQIGDERKSALDLMKENTKRQEMALKRQMGQGI